MEFNLPPPRPISSTASGARAKDTRVVKLTAFHLRLQRHRSKGQSQPVIESEAETFPFLFFLFIFHFTFFHFISFCFMFIYFIFKLLSLAANISHGKWIFPPLRKADCHKTELSSRSTQPALPRQFVFRSKFSSSSSFFYISYT